MHSSEFLVRVKFFGKAAFPIRKDIKLLRKLELTNTAAPVLSCGENEAVTIAWHFFLIRMGKPIRKQPIQQVATEPEFSQGRGYRVSLEPVSGTVIIAVP